MSFDPYGVLGLHRAASGPEVKAAYRARVQSAHPDRGGDPELFILVTRAFDVLADPEARKLYDETGIVDEEGLKTFRREVARVLVDMFDAAVEAAMATGLDISRVDFVGQMRSAVETGIGDARLRLKRMERDAGSLRKLSGRIRRGDAARNIFALRIDEQLAAKAEEQAVIRRRILLLEAGLTELGNYSTEVELIAALEADEGR